MNGIKVLDLKLLVAKGLTRFELVTEKQARMIWVQMKMTGLRIVNNLLELFATLAILLLQ